MDEKAKSPLVVYNLPGDARYILFTLISGKQKGQAYIIDRETNRPTTTRPMNLRKAVQQCERLNATLV